MALKYKKCPKCGSKNAAKIVYGLPIYNYNENGKQDNVVFGGCCFSEDSPEYTCRGCGYEWNRKQVIDMEYGKMQSIKASVGGFWGPNYDAYFDLKNKKVSWSGRDLDGNEDSIERDICDEEIDMFIEELKKIGFLGWKTKYIEPNVCDGTQWCIDIETSEKKIHKYGDNKFPREWDMFCRLVERITGSDFR